MRYRRTRRTSTLLHRGSHVSAYHSAMLTSFQTSARHQPQVPWAIDGRPTLSPMTHAAHTPPLPTLLVEIWRVSTMQHQLRLRPYHFGFNPMRSAVVSVAGVAPGSCSSSVAGSPTGSWLLPMHRRRETAEADGLKPIVAPHTGLDGGWTVLDEGCIVALAMRLIACTPI